ncbi:MAG: hypothetical protein C0506_00265 [Anaerolinea sp.]|nr:hypothetical protein [Anaerolinea sp.]
MCVRGPSRSGKTSLCERLVAGLVQSGLRVAYLKRTHHVLDLPGKSSARVWANEPALMVLRATDRLQVTTMREMGPPETCLSKCPRTSMWYFLRRTSGNPTRPSCRRSYNRRTARPSSGPGASPGLTPLSSSLCL